MIAAERMRKPRVGAPTLSAEGNSGMKNISRGLFAGLRREVRRMIDGLKADAQKSFA